MIHLEEISKEVFITTGLGAPEAPRVNKLMKPRFHTLQEPSLGVGQLTITHVLRMTDTQNASDFPFEPQCKTEDGHRAFRQATSAYLAAMQQARCGVEITLPHSEKAFKVLSYRTGHKHYKQQESEKKDSSPCKLLLLGKAAKPRPGGCLAASGCELLPSCCPQSRGASPRHPSEPR